MIEAESVRVGAGWFRLPGRGVLAVRGSDRVRFLNGQLTQDVAALEAQGPGAGGYSFLLTPQGRIVADLHIVMGADELWLECERARLEAVVARLDRYLVADDVELVDESAHWVRFGVEGPNAHELVPEAGMLLADHCVSVVVAGTELKVVAAGWTAFPAAQLWVPPDASSRVERALLEKGLRHGLVPASPETLEMLRVEAGVPGSGELDEEVLPAETGVLERAVSFEKGCYTGQEVVARMESRGRMAHRLVGLVGAKGGGPFEVGAELFAGGRKVGAVTSAVQSSRLGAIALAFVRIAHSQPGTDLSLDGAMDRPTTVHALPFAVPQ